MENVFDIDIDDDETATLECTACKCEISEDEYCDRINVFMKIPAQAGSQE